MFKTLRRGWGIRCLDDIPKGGFICVYAGQLLTESIANEVRPACWRVSVGQMCFLDV